MAGVRETELVEVGQPVKCVNGHRLVAGPKSFKVGRRVLYLRTDVEQWLAEARAGAG